MTSNDSVKMKRAYTKHTCGDDCNKPRCIKRQRDSLVKVNKLLTTKVNVAAQIIDSLQNNVNVLMKEIEDRKTNRHWLLRKLGL